MRIALYLKTSRCHYPLTQHHTPEDRNHRVICYENPLNREFGIYCHKKCLLLLKLIQHKHKDRSAVSTAVVCKTDLREELPNVMKRAAGTGTYDEVSWHQSFSIFCWYHERDSFMTASQEVNVASVLSKLVRRDMSELSMQPRCLHHLV